MKIKAFTFTDPHGSEIEEEINKWLSRNPNITIIDRGQTQSSPGAPGRRTFDVTVTIWYEENK